jgi:cystathionine beta-lyase
MAKYNFDTVIDRRNSDALKFNVLQERYGDANLLPLWVADMDFATPDFILEALKQRLEHPVLGYATIPDDYFPCIADWIKSHHNWDVKQEWLSYIPGIVKGIGFAINVFVKEDEKVIIQPPVYHPFRIVPEMLNRGVVYNPLIENADGTYSMDFDNLAAVADSKCRMLILSNPHNPAGITWSADTLRQLADFCSKRNILVISDEIHCDMVLWGKKHIPFATVSDAAANCSITFGAPSKTFNIAGVVSSYSVIPNDDIRNKYYNWLTANELNDPTVFSPIATIAAFRKGEEWRQQMLAYIEGNINYVIDFCKQNIPAIKPLKPDASFLVWLDCRALGLSHDALVDLFVKDAKLALNDGAMFGEKGNGFMRLNIATPRSVLTTALNQLSAAVKNNQTSH